MVHTPDREVGRQMEITLKGVSKQYKEQAAIENLSLSLREGEIACVLGPSGAGKTTLLQILAGLTPYEGEVSGRPERISYVFQSARLFPNLTVRQNLEFVLPESEKKRISSALCEVGLQDKENAYPHALSGGQAQRVAFLRAFLYPSELILMDEPFSSLDTALKIRLIELFVKLWNREKRTVLFVTHDAEEAAMMSQRTLFLREGKLIADFSDDSPLPRAYGTPSAYKKQILARILNEE